LDGTPGTTSHACALRPLRTKPRHSGFHTNFTVAPMSLATSSARRFSNPSPCAFEKGMLFGSAQTLSSRADAGLEATAAAASAQHAKLGKREDIERASLCCDVRQILHRIDETEGGRSIPLVEASGNDRARPSANTRQDRNVLLSVWSLPRRW